jgi:hypothetical protein
MFENPAEHTPHESSEGGYLYIWGGPYEARDELFAEFGDYVPEDVIEEIESGGTVDWAPGPDHPDHKEARDEWERRHQELADEGEPLADLDEIVRRPEAGARPTGYGDGWEREQRARAVEKLEWFGRMGNAGAEAFVKGFGTTAGTAPRYASVPWSSRPLASSSRKSDCYECIAVSSRPKPVSCCSEWPPDVVLFLPASLNRTPAGGLTMLKAVLRALSVVALYVVAVTWELVAGVWREIRRSFVAPPTSEQVSDQRVATISAELAQGHEDGEAARDRIAACQPEALGMTVAMVGWSLLQGKTPDPAVEARLPENVRL